MQFDKEEIITEIEEGTRKFGRGFGERCVGTSKDTRGPFFRRHQQTDVGDGLAYREAFTSNAAQAVVSHLVNDRGLELDGDSVPEPGRLVFVYCKTPPAPAAARSEQATYPKLAS